MVGANIGACGVDDKGCCADASAILGRQGKP